MERQSGIQLRGRLLLSTGTALESPVVHERIRITTAGNVGIGTASPSAKLAINGGLHVGGTSDPGDNNATVDGLLTTNSLVLSTGVWDDLCVIPPYAINPVGPDGSMTVITSGTGYLGCIQADAINESCVVNFQIPHGYQRGTDVKPHLHVVRNDGADNTGNVEFEARFLVCPVIGAAGSWSAYSNGNTSQQPADGAGQAGIIQWTLANSTYAFNISNVIICHIRRSGTTTGSVAITSADLHGKRVRFGSTFESELSSASTSESSSPSAT